MKLYLVRHGEYLADDIKQPGALSEKGRQEIEKMAAFLSRLHLPVSRIFHSGKRRTEETAGILSHGFVCERDSEAKRGLEPMDDVQAFIDEILDWDEDLVIVGHLPFLSQMTSQLVMGNKNRELIAFHPGTLVCLEKVENTRCLIHWVIGPDVISLI